MNYKVAQLAIHDPHHSTKAGEILIQPAPAEGQGHLFILIEIDSNLPADHQFIQQFLEIAYGVYEQSQLHQPEKILENILKALNENLTPTAPRRLNWFNRLHCFIGLLFENTLYFSAFGKIKNFLIKATAIKEIAVQPAEANKKILFDFTLSGQLKKGDRFLITTESLINYISLEKIKKTLAALPPYSAVAHLTNILEAAPPTVSFFSIVLQIISQDQLTSPAAASSLGKLAVPTGSKNSLDQLLKTQRETEKILTSPSLVEILKDRLRQKSSPPKPKLKSVRQARQATLIRSRPQKALLFSLNLKPLRRLFPSLKTAGQKLWLFLMEKQKRSQLNKNLTNKLQKLIKKFASLSKVNKLLFILVIILLLLFSQNLIWQGRKLKVLKSNQFYQNLLTQIYDKQNGIEAALIYNDTIKAKQLLTETDDLLKQFPQEAKEKIKEYQKIKAQVQVLFEKVWKVINILEPVVLINFREINLTAEINSLAFKDDYLYGFNNTNQLFAVNVQNNNTLVFDHFNLAVNKANLFPKNNDLIVATADNEFYTIKENEWQKIPASLPSNLQKIDDLSFYLDKMYLLDRGAKQIFRLTYQANNFRAPMAWVREDLPIDKTVSLAIDGFIYALKEDGAILKLASGLNQNFPKIVIEPKLTSPTKIYTEEASNDLYVLEPKNSRFLVISKEGELKNQYYSKKFNNLKDFIVSAKEKKVYLLNGAQVFVVAIK